MQRLLLGAALLAAVCLAVRAEDKKDEKKEEKADFSSLRMQFITKFRGATSPDDRQEALKEYGPKFLEMAESSGKGKDGFGATVFALQIGGMSKNAQLTDKAIATFKKNHLDSPLLAGDAMSAIAGALGDKASPLMKEIMEKGATDEIKAAAVSSLLEAKEKALVDATGDDKKKIEQEMADLRKVGVDKYKLKDLFIGAKLPDLKSEDLKGKEVKLSDYKGKVVVLDVWATWCPPCRAMIPHERKLVERLKDKPFELISISFDEKKETLEAFLEKEKMPWTHWWNGRKGDLGAQLNVRFFPTIFVLDGNGVIRYKGVRGEAMDKAVDALLKEMEDAKKSS